MEREKRKNEKHRKEKKQRIALKRPEELEKRITPLGFSVLMGQGGGTPGKGGGH